MGLVHTLSAGFAGSGFGFADPGFGCFAGLTRMVTVLALLSMIVTG